MKSLQQTLEAEVLVERRTVQGFPAIYVSVSQFGLSSIFSYLSNAETEEAAVEQAYGYALYEYQCLVESPKKSRKYITERATVGIACIALKAKYTELQPIPEETAQQRAARLARQILNEAARHNRHFMVIAQKGEALPGVHPHSLGRFASRFVTSHDGDDYAKHALARVVKAKGWQDGHAMVSGLMFVISALSKANAKNDETTEAEASGPGEA